MIGSVEGSQPFPVIGAARLAALLVVGGHSLQQDRRSGVLLGRGGTRQAQPRGSQKSRVLGIDRGGLAGDGVLAKPGAIERPINGVACRGGSPTAA